MDHNARDNYYLALDLDPAIDEWAAIEARLEEKRREWSKQAVYGPPARQHEAKINLKRLEEMARRLKVPEERAAVRAEARKIRSAREASARRRLDEHIELLRTQGFYKREDLRRLHQDLDGDLSQPVIEETLSRSGLVLADAQGVGESGMPVRPRINPTVQGEIRRLLDQLQLKTLYDLLEMSPRTDLGALFRQADEVSRHYRPLTDPDSTARNKLSGHARNIFSNEVEKQKYDNTIEVEAMNRLHGLIDTAGLSGLISTEALDRLLRLAADGGVKPDDARSYIEEYAARKKWLVQPAGRSSGPALKICGFCSTLAHALTDTKCSNCHEPLEVPCPRCGLETPTERERCTRCGFPTGSIPLLQALLQSGRRLIGERRFEEALGQLDRALLIYEQWEPARRERERARGALEALVAAEQEVDTLVDAGRFVHAAATLSGLEKTWGAERWAARRVRVEERLSRARVLFGEGERLLRDGGSEAAWSKFDEALALAGDLEAARAAKANCPPPPPNGLEATVVPSGFALAWSAPAAAGPVFYRVVRKEESAPRDPEDGTVLPTQPSFGVTRAEDGQAAAGRVWHYAVYSLREGILSREGAVAGPVIRTSEVEAMHAAIGDRRATLSWKLPEGARSTVVRRRLEAAGESGDWSPPLPVRQGETRFTDAELENEISYRYRIAAVFSLPGGAEITSAGKEVVVTPSAPPDRVVEIKVCRERSGIRISWESIECQVPSVVVIRSAARPSWEVGQILPLSTLSTLGRALVEVGVLGGRDPAPDPEEAYYHLFSANRLLAAYCGTVQFAEVRQLHASREDGQIVLRWRWPEGCPAVEVTSAPEGRENDAGTALVVRRSGQEPSGLVRLPIDGLAPGRRIFRVRCLLDAGDSARVAGTGQAVDELVWRSCELRWTFKRRPFGLGTIQLVIEAEDLSGLERIRLVGKVNDRPTSAEDGCCLLDWKPANRLAVPPRLVLAVPARRDPRGETFCRLFIEPSDLVRIDDPPVGRTVL